MEVNLEVLLSTSIKQKKPWPRISWLGQEKEAIFLLDDKYINEINLLSGKTKKKIPRLQLLLKNVVSLTTSSNDAWLAGLLNTGEIFLWNKDQDCLKTVSATEESKKLITVALECSLRLYIYVSGDGKRVLLTIPSGCILLWECLESENIIYSKNSSLFGQWTQIKPEKSIILPSPEDKEAVVDAVFIRNELLGDCCLCSFTFYSGEYLMLTFLALQWHENISQSISSLSYQVHWAHQECFLCTLVPKCESVKSRGALIIAFSRDGLTLAVALNQKDPKATQILFINILNFVTLSGSLKGCSNKNPVVPSRLIRSYWVGDISWTHDSLFLACVLKRGSLVLLSCLGELLTLITFGCSVEFGPAEFIPLHPLITYRPQQFVPQDSAYSPDSSASDNDLMRQRFSVKTHSRLPYLIVSDGYMVTLLRFFDNLTPSVLMKSFLLESTQRLEKIHQGLISKPKGKNLRLRSLDSLRSSLLKHQGNQNSVASAIPRFLQAEEEIGELTEKMTDLQDHEIEESNNSKQFPNNFLPFWNQKNDSLFEEGRLEFASMFDTIHAKDDSKEKDDTITELHSVQKNLLAAWNIGISKNVEHKKLMLNYTVICITHFLYILQFVKCPPKQNIFLNKTIRHNAWLHCVFQLFHQCLSVQYWDLRYRQEVGHLVKLTSQTLKLMFIQQQQDQLFSDTLLGCFSLLKMVSDNLNGIYALQHHLISASTDGNRTINHESLVVPIFQKLSNNCTEKLWSWNSFIKMPPQSVNLVQKPGHRLSILWQLLYKRTLWYQAHLNRMDPKDDGQLTQRIAHEESVVTSLLCHVQAVLQTAGCYLNQTLELKSVIGEEYFLLGSYEESVQLWKKALQETKTIGGKRTCILQTRYYLAQLYCHLYCYNLNDAQGMCDHLVREILRQSQMSIKEEEYIPVSENFLCDFGIIGNVRLEAAVVVVRCMARFMASYFTNQQLYVLPPHNVGVLPPLHIESEQSVRIIPLQHSKVASVIRDQNLSYLWTVEYALELLFITGLIPEAVWLAHRLGDWKMAVSIGLAFKLCYKSNSNLSRCKKKDLTLPLNMTPTRIFQEKLQCFLGQPASLEVANELGPKYKQFTDPIEEEDVDLLFNSIQEILKAAVMADADILSETFQLLIDSAKDFSKRLWGLVPMGLYLPSPPLYCPQPAVISEDHGDDLLLKAEKDYRQKVSGILQRVLLLFRAACCSFPAAQWYILKLRWARKVMQKIRIKGSLPLLSPFPESLLHYCKVGMAFYRPGAPEDQKLDEVSCKTIGCFRELCALCWMLHVREKLSYSCRQYQKAREDMEKKKDMELEFDSCMVEHCLSALEWACRMLPFSRFMNIEELVQDIILSLIGELPPTRKVAEILVKAFPNSEDIRVPLRDKYNSLHQRLRHCTVKGPQTEEMMSVIMHSIYKVRVKALKRVRRNIGPFEINIWEPPEEETVDKIHTYDRFSLGTGLSTSTPTEVGNSQAHSDTETADTFSEALSSEKKRENAQNHAEFTLISKHGNKKKKFKSEECPERKGDYENFPRENIVPTVGVWEFERDDDEYIKFLDLFLSYVLEKDLIGSNNPGIPFLSSFTSHLKEHELNSLLFDVHTTLKRRQGKPTSQNVFRAGSCYVIIPESCEFEKSSTLNSENFKNLGNQTSSPSVLVVPGPRSLIQKFSNEVIKSTRKKGLFGLKEKSMYRIKDDNREMTTSHRLPKQAFLPQNFKTAKFTFKAVQWNDIIPHEELSPELKNKFGSIAKLLEWMIRWSDRRLLCDSTKPESSCQYSPVLRVRTSAAAILTSLWLLEQSYFVQQTNPVICEVPENHYSVPSMLLPETKQNIEKENSVDTGCPASVPTPNEIQEVHNSDGPNHNLLEITTQSKDHENKELIEESISFTHVTDKEFTDFDEDILEEMETFTQEEIKVPDYGEKSEESFGSLKNTDFSISLMSLEGQLEEQHSRKKVEYPLKESVEVLAKTSSEQDGMIETVADTKLTVPHLFCLDTSAETPSIQVSAPKDQSASVPPLVSDTTSVSSNTPISKRHRSRKDVSPAQLPNSSEPIRQMLHDELFRLVQLQQINFMSLMQIVGSSFASLPNMQLTQQSQNVHLEGSQILGPTRGSGDVEPTGTNLKKDFLLECIGENSRQFEKSRPHHEGIVQPDQNKVGNNQNIPSFCVPSGHLDGQSSNGKVTQKSKGLSLTPGSPAYAANNHFHLLSTTPTIHKNPILIPAVKTLNPASGFPLLKIQIKHEFKPLSVCTARTPQVTVRPPPEPKEAWGSSSSGKNLPSTAQSITRTSHLNLSQYDAETVQKALEQKRWAEIRTIETPKHLNLDQYVEQETLTPQRDSSVKKQEKIFDVKPELFEIPNQNFLGVPLLHLQLNPTTRFSPALRPSVSTPSIPSRPKEKERDPKEILYPSIKLLQTCLPPERKCQKPKLIPLENLIAFKQSQQKQSPYLFEHMKPGNICLLKAKIDQKKENKKRERRRAKKDLQEKSSEKQKKQEKKCVTFRSEDSIINPDDLEVFVKQEDQQEQPIPQPTDSFVIPFESLEEDITTAAGLHYMASVKKKVVENQDASTNTDPVQEYLSVPQMLAPDVYLNLRFPSETSEALLTSDPTSNVVGHNYINVIDIEGTDLLQELPVREETTDDIVNKQEGDSMEIPSSADLHYMAASVTNVIPPDQFMNKDLPKVQPQVQESTVKSGGVEDYLTWKRCQNFSAPPYTVPSEKNIDIEHLTTKLLEIDEKLLVLQNIATNVEQDFSNTKLVCPPCALVKTEDPLELSYTPEVDKETTFSQTFRSPKEAYSFSHQIEEEEEETPLLEFPETKHPVWNSCSFSSVISSFNVSSEQITSTGTASNEDSFGSVSADFQITGLTDVADIIGDLITESGVSSEELGLTERQAKKISRIHGTPKKRKSQRTEKEKREIRAWMKKKRKERMAEYLAQLAEKRKQEHEPFQSPKHPLCMTSKEISLYQRMKNEKDRLQLSEHYHRRVTQAYDLMNELLFESAQVPKRSLTKPPGSPPKSPHISRRQHHLPPSGKDRTIRTSSPSRNSKVRFASKPTYICGKSPLRQYQHSPQPNKMSAIPINKTTEITKKPALNGSCSSDLSSQDFAYPPQRARSIKSSEGSISTSNAEEYRRGHRKMSSWAVPEGADKVLCRSPDSFLENFSPAEDEGFPISISGLDSGSESTSSILSKIDWCAIDDLVATVENT